jgi:hypothetical protein
MKNSTYSNVNASNSTGSGYTGNVMNYGYINSVGNYNYQGPQKYGGTVSQQQISQQQLD